MRAHQRAQARDELVERERLGHVVVAAGLEAGQPVDQRVAGGEEEHRRLHPLGPERLAGVAPVAVGEADVDHEDVGLGDRDALEQLRAGADGLAAEPLLAQAAGEHRAQRGVVLDDQHQGRQHGVSIAPWNPRGRAFRSSSGERRNE